MDGSGVWKGGKAANTGQAPTKCCFIHILMHNLHDNPAISFSLQMKKRWLTKVQRHVYGHISAKWQKRLSQSDSEGHALIIPSYLKNHRRQMKGSGQWNQPFPFLDIWAVAVGWQRRHRAVPKGTLNKQNKPGFWRSVCFLLSCLPLSLHSPRSHQRQD